MEGERTDQSAHQNDFSAKVNKFDGMSWMRVVAVLTSLGLCVLLYGIEQTIVSTAVSDIGRGVNATGSLTWITTSYLLTSTVVQPVVGRLSDVFGTKRMLIIEVWIFVIGNIIAGVAKSLPHLVAGRLISGIGGAGLFSLAIIMVSQLTNERQRGLYLNLINLAFVASDTIGPTIGGILAKSGNWRWIFLINAPIGPAVTLALVFLVHVSRAPQQYLSMRSMIKDLDLDLTGMFMLMSSLSLLIVALNIGGEARPWDSPTIIGLFSGCGVSFLAFLVAEKYAKYPLVPLSLFVIGNSEVISAALVIPFLLAVAVASLLSGWIVNKTGHIRLTILCSLAFTPIGEGLLSLADENATLGEVAGYSLLVGFGFGGAAQLSIVVAQAGLPNDLLPTITALLTTTPSLGGVLGVGIIGTVINNVFRARLQRQVDISQIPRLNDAVASSRDPQIGAYVVSAYVHASQIGFQILAGVAVVQVILFLGTRSVLLNKGHMSHHDVRGTSAATPVEVSGDLEAQTRRRVDHDQDVGSSEKAG
ncbi:MFS general substrate transporter [Panus rudis PR-1116 ss-1]|nr:MFS general substrate transporter [Panus rudis PR-1116 ss-1]